VPTPPIYLQILETRGKDCPSSGWWYPVGVKNPILLADVIQISTFQPIHNDFINVEPSSESVKQTFLTDSVQNQSKET